MSTDLMSGTDKARPTVTLRKYLATTAAFPKVSAVKVIFRPGKYVCYSFITEAGYRVNVYDDQSGYLDLVTGLEQFINEEACLGVRIDDPEKADWTLVTIDGSNTRWEEFEWGWRGDTIVSSLPASKKTSTPSKARDGGEGKDHTNPRSLRRP